MSLRPWLDSDDVSEAVEPIVLTNRRHSSYTYQLQPSQQRSHSLVQSRAHDTSDADASSDFSSFSEIDLPRDEDSDGYSEYETPLGGRWDLTAHWHLGDYSEGVEGDADDDDEEERGNDTDLSEGPRLSRRINLDISRVRDILGSSPSSTPVILPGSSAAATTAMETTHDGEGLDLALSLRSFTFGLNASTSEGLEANRFQSRQSIAPSVPSERTVRFSRDPQRIYIPTISSDMTELNSNSTEHYTQDSYGIHPDMYNADTDDSQGDGEMRPEYQSSTDSISNRDRHISSVSINNDSSDDANQLGRTTLSSSGTAVASGYDVSLHLGNTGASSSSLSQNNIRSVNHRIHTLERPLSPSLGREERRHHLYHYARNTVAAVSRQSLSSTPRGYISPYWSAHGRYQQHLFSTSPISSLSPSPASSVSSSRIASPTPESPSLLSQRYSDVEDDTELNLNLDQQQNLSSESRNDNNLWKVGLQLSGDGTLERTPSHSAAIVDNRHCRVTSSNISSLPSFATSVFMPRIQANSCYVYNGSEGVTGTWRLYKSLKPNHPRRQCCFLQPGQKLGGTQNSDPHTSPFPGIRSRQQEKWRVKVIIDFENHTFWTKKWAAKADTDLEHWRRMEAFQGLDKKYFIKGAKTGRFRGHVEQKYIFMRWKEKHFVNMTEHTSGLTIAGFYYVSMRRSDGFIEGYYHDKDSTPFQHLTLNPIFETNGFSTSIFQIA
ncbi:hypothetical protein BGZ46_009232 [Entomortierella lignicola]|nr:hypothetical protein BGZ46_009232 [Entomortierella lignicola]